MNQAVTIQTDGYLCGWRVLSDLALPELAPWVGDDRAADIRMRLGQVPDQLDDIIDDKPFLQVGRSGELLLRLENVGVFHVKSPFEVVVAPSAAATDAEVRLFLLGSVLGFLCHLRGLFPLHASCLDLGGRVVAFSGPSGAGKSTTALHLARRGHALLADDVCVIDTADPKTPMVLPAFPRLKLWQDTLEAVGVAPDGLDFNRQGQNKYHLRQGGDFRPEPVPLSAIFLLALAQPGAPAEVRRMNNPLEIVAELNKEVFRPRVAGILGRRQTLFAAQAAVAAAVPVFRLSRPQDIARIGGWLDEVEILART